MLKKILRISLYIIMVLCILPTALLFIHAMVDFDGLYFTISYFLDLLFNELEFFYIYFRTVVLVLIIVQAQILVSIGVSYYCSISKSIISKMVFYIYIFLLIMPIQIMLIPNTILFYNLESIFNITFFDRYISIILPGAFSTMAVVFLKLSFDQIEGEIYESARVEGASTFQLLKYIVIPCSYKHILSLAVVLFVEYWGMLEQALVFIDSKSRQVISVYLSAMFFKSNSNAYAASVLYLLPLGIIYLGSVTYYRKVLRVSNAKAKITD